VDASHHNNGNVISISNYYDTTRSQQFFYDQVNRIVTAETTSTYATSPAHCWGEAYVYDNATTTLGEFGNLTNINVASSAYNGCTQESLSVISSAANQITTFSYDAAGNVLNDTHNSYLWDAENRIKTAAGINYTYDGDGHRVQKSNGKIYWYGVSSDVLDESDSSGNITDEYIFFGGKRVARRVVSGNGIYYYSRDFLGSSRQIYTSASALCYDADFYPFGGERAYNNSCAQNYKFTGKERDSESNLDNFGARYNSSSAGRFMSPDPVHIMKQRLTDPQQWNMYSYVRNNPLHLVDNTGKWPTAIHNQIYDAAFPGLSSKQRDELKRMSAWVDRPAGQMKEHNHEHAMKSPGEDPATAKRAIDQNISNHEQAAQQSQGGTPEHASQINTAALDEFAQAAHTATDRTSPAHTDSAGNPRDWNGIPNPLNDNEVADVEAHTAEEAIATPEQFEAAVVAAQQAFKATFGDAAFQDATTIPSPSDKKDPNASGGSSQ
jgi:RHS repeat-associated protein